MKLVVERYCTKTIFSLYWIFFLGGNRHLFLTSSVSPFVRLSQHRALFFECKQPFIKCMFVWMFVWLKTNDDFLKLCKTYVFENREAISIYLSLLIITHLKRHEIENLHNIRIWKKLTIMIINFWKFTKETIKAVETLWHLRNWRG